MHPHCFIGCPMTFTGEAGERITFGTFGFDPMCVLFAFQGVDGRQFACLVSDEVEAGLLSFLRDRARACQDVDQSCLGPDGTGS